MYLGDEMHCTSNTTLCVTKEQARNRGETLHREERKRVDRRFTESLEGEKREERMEGKEEQKN